MSIDLILERARAVNIAEDFTEKELDKMADDLIMGLDSDKASRAEWEEKSEDYLKLALQVLEYKGTPWPDASNIKFPMLSIAAMQFNARMYPTLVSGFDIVKGIPVGFDPTGEKSHTAVRVGKHMSYQILHEMEEWEDDMDKGLFVLPIMGTFFKKTYYDVIEERNRSELVMPQDLVVNFYSKSLKDAPRISHLMTMSSNEIYENMVQGLFLDVGLFDEEETDSTEEGTKSYTTSDSDAEVSPSLGIYGQHVDEVQGLSEPSMVDSAIPHELVEMHCLMDLDDDGYAEPYIVTLHIEQKKVLRIAPRYQTTGVLFDEAEEGGDVLLKIIADEYFTNYVFIPDPQSGVYGIGFGTLLGPINEAVNTLINQLVDAGTLSNLQSGFISPGIKVKGGVFKFKPGEWKLAQIVGDNINNKILPLPVREPSNVLFMLLGLLTSEAEKLAGTMDIMTGELPGQNTKATVALQAVEQGSKVFKAVSKRLYRAFTKELKKLYILNGTYLDDTTYFNILDTAQDQPLPIAANDYDVETVDIMPSADPTVSSQTQQINKIQAMQVGLEMGTINPQEFTRRLAVATEQPDIPTLMQMPPPQPDQEFEFEKAVKQAELTLEARRVAMEEFKAQAAALKDQGAYLESLAEISEKIQSGNIAEAKSVVEEQQAKFSNVIDMANLDDSEDEKKEETKATPTKGE